ncbi:MAG: SagB/ThcOx family dehydrogenase [bacterium]|nr:SagB/ThcOx family dehydrogenase [bacterium]
MIKLPLPEYDSYFSVEKALHWRRSVRAYKNDPLSLEELSQLLWAGQGITNKEGYRTAPSAGALYPLEIYAAAGNVLSIDPGVYKYDPGSNALDVIAERNVIQQFKSAMVDQDFVSDAPLILVVSAVFERTTEKYGKRGINYVYMDIGLACENIHLQAVSLGMGTVVMGAFQENIVRDLIGMPAEETPVIIMPICKI